jgi:hypothetical protein
MAIPSENLNQSKHLRDLIHSAKESDILNILKNAKVTVGHLNGRHIHVHMNDYHTNAPSIKELWNKNAPFSDWIKPGVTFTEIVERVELIYNEKMGPIIKEVDRYLKETGLKSDCKKWGLEVPLSESTPIYSGLKKQKPYPQIPQEEIEEIQATIAWRKEVDSLLETLYDKSRIWKQSKTEGCFSKVKITRAWDSFLNYSAPWRKNHELDNLKLNWLISVQGKEVPASNLDRVIEQIKSLQQANKKSSPATLLPPAFDSLEYADKKRIMLPSLLERRRHILEDLCDKGVEEIRQKINNGEAVTHADINLSEKVYSLLRMTLANESYFSILKEMDQQRSFMLSISNILQKLEKHISLGEMNENELISIKQFCKSNRHKLKLEHQNRILRNWIQKANFIKAEDLGISDELWQKLQEEKNLDSEEMRLMENKNENLKQVLMNSKFSPKNDFPNGRTQEIIRKVMKEETNTYFKENPKAFLTSIYDKLEETLAIIKTL